MLTALRFDLSWLERHGTQEKFRTRARQGLDTLNQAVLSVHRIMRDLRPPALDAGIVAALDFLASQTTRRTGIEVTLNSNHDSIDLAEAIAITVYRVAQEALTNVAKHSEATSAHIDLMVRDDTLSIEVSDNGRGIRQQDVHKKDSFGLRGLTERVRQVKGWLDISTDVGRATLIATIPLTEQAAARLEDGIEG
jgi:signal transduction histidine kinase